MEYVIKELSAQAVDHIIFAVGYKGSMVEEYFGDGQAFGVHASYAYEESLLGTAGAIKNGQNLQDACPLPATGGSYPAPKILFPPESHQSDPATKDIRRR